ncbi:hypothetical protein LINPERPRIM_LOCUS4927 [Linum perenne]
MAVAVPLRFATLILDTATQGRTFRLSREFSNRLNTTTVTIRVPTGDTWEVQINCDMDGIVLLNDGLMEFFNFYSIANKFVIMLEYVGPSTINATIFSNDELEIEYPIMGDANNEEEDHSDLDME